MAGMIRRLGAAGKPYPARTYVFASRWGIISGLISRPREEENMEAERINALTALLADLTNREAELRRYL
jgi:hypothetical protein